MVNRMNLKDAAEMALDALESYSKSDYIKKQHPLRYANGNKAIEALRTALAQPEQEPVGWQFFQDGRWHDGTYLHNHRKNTEADGYPVRDLYTAPPKRDWVGLTDEERYLNDGRTEEEIEYARAIEAKLREKNGHP